MNFRARKPWEKSTTNSRNCLRIAWASSRSDVTTVLCPDPYSRDGGPFRTRLQRGIKNRGFDKIKKKKFRRNDHQTMKIFFSERKFGVRCTLKKLSIGISWYVPNYANDKMPHYKPCLYDQSCLSCCQKRSKLCFWHMGLDWYDYCPQ